MNKNIGKNTNLSQNPCHRLLRKWIKQCLLGRIRQVFKKLDQSEVSKTVKIIVKLYGPNWAVFGVGAWSKKMFRVYWYTQTTFVFLVLLYSVFLHTCWGGWVGGWIKWEDNHLNQKLNLLFGFLPELGNILNL